MLLSLPLLLLTQPPAAGTLAEWGLSPLRQVRAELYLPARQLYSEHPGGGPAFLWGGGVQLAALVAAARWDPQYRPWLDAYSSALEAYWNPAGPTPGYDCLPLPKPVDRYYDDNAWLVLAWLEAAAELHEPRYQALAERALTYVLSGGDDRLGGGLYWRESDRLTKNTCASAPAALACLRLAELGQPAHADRGHELLEWTVAQFRDPVDQLFWDHRVVADGRLVTWKFSYNAALPIRAWLAAARLRPDQAAACRAAAQRTADAALARWYRPDSGLFSGSLRFDHLLAEALLELSAATGEPRYAAAAAAGAVALHDRGADPAGHYPEKIAAEQPRPATLPRWSLLDQASAARWFLAVALARRNAP
ncbi:MAG: hypothetical protein IT204_17655 [Fimbriimonadaceae bacterium]|nr:hypothetical protein [Fimbriimonadaceae bacterium]